MALIRNGHNHLQKKRRMYVGVYLRVCVWEYVIFIWNVCVDEKWKKGFRILRRTNLTENIQKVFEQKFDGYFFTANCTKNIPNIVSIYNSFISKFLNDNFMNTKTNKSNFFLTKLGHVRFTFFLNFKWRTWILWKCVYVNGCL